MKRGEVLLWTVVIVVLGVMNFRGGQQASFRPPPPTAVPAIARPLTLPARRTMPPDHLVRSKDREARDTAGEYDDRETRPVVTADTLPAEELPHTEAPATRAVETMPADQIDVLASAALMERQNPLWPAPRRLPCSFVEGLYDAVLDTGGDARQRLAMSLVNLYVANSTGRVADVASKTLHNLVALMRSRAKHVFTLSVTNDMFVTARHVLDEFHRECAGNTDISDASVKLEGTAGWDVVVTGSVTHATSLVDSVRGGHIVVKRYFIVAQSVLDSTVSNMDGILKAFMKSSWLPELFLPEIGIAVFRNPNYRPALNPAPPRDTIPEMVLDAAHNAHGQDYHAASSADGAPSTPTTHAPLMAASADLVDREIPQRITDHGHRATYRQLQRRLQRAKDAGDEVGVQRFARQLEEILEHYPTQQPAAAAAGGMRSLLQLSDASRVVTRKRPLAVCVETFAGCKPCRTELLCVDKEDISATEKELETLDRMFPPSAATLATLTALNLKLPMAPYIPFIALHAFGVPIDARIVVLGCYASLIAGVIGGARGAYDRITVVSSAVGCEALRPRIKGGIRQRVPEASKIELVQSAKFYTMPANVSMIVTTTRFLNKFPSIVSALKSRTVILVAGTDSEEPLTMNVGGVEATRLRAGVGMTVFARSDTHSV